MHTAIQSKTVTRAAMTVLTCLVFTAGSTGVASANVGLCSPRLISENIKDAVLMLKANELCRGIELPYTHDEARERLESLRCGEQASNIIDNMVQNYQREFKTIMQSDPNQTVCKVAATLSWD